MSDRITSTDLFALTLYQFINILFVYKYATRFLPHPWLWICCYLIGISALLILLYMDFDFRLPQKTSNAIFIGAILLIALILTITMLHVDPGQIRVGRYPALKDWLGRLLVGQYPYVSPALPSGFPFLFLLALPFYLLGDLGLLQIFAFLVYGLILQFRYGSKGTNRLRTLILLTGSPVFIYEIAVRSDLFSNMALVMLYMYFCEKRVREVRIPALLVIGFTGGLLLATRGVVLLVFILFFGYLFRNQLKRGLIFSAGIVSGFTVVNLPFIFWNTQYYIRQGPFTIQTSYLPIWLSASLILLCVYLAGRARSRSIVYKYITSILFTAVFIAFLISLAGRGWTATMLGDRFDISYFCFTLPFLLLLLNYGRTRSDPGRMVSCPADRQTVE